jgi:hypothetical protein
MKVGRITLIVAIMLMAPVAVLAQQKVNTIHRSQSTVAASKATVQSVPLLTGKWDIVSTDKDGDPYNLTGGTYLGPIEFTADFTQGGTALTQVAGHTFTSSACSADGTATVGGTINPDGNSGNADVQFTATVDQGYTYVFQGSYNKKYPGEITGSLSTNGGACGAQDGKFTAYQYNQLTNNSYVGEFASDVYGTHVNGVTVNIKEANSYSVSGAISGPVNSCFNGLIIDPTQSFTSGGLVDFLATNTQGAQVAFLASNTNSSNQQLPNDQPNESSVYLTYVVFQGGGACPAGDTGHDAVFELAKPKPIKLPIRLHFVR